MTATFEDVREANIRYEAGASAMLCRQAVEPANELFGGDALQGLLYLMANGYAISVGNGLPYEERRAARAAWNYNRAINESEWLRERYGTAVQDPE